MPQENRTWDKGAFNLYMCHKGEKDWPHFYHLKRKERDYWRALAQVAQEDNLWPDLENAKPTSHI